MNIRNILHCLLIITVSSLQLDFCKKWICCTVFKAHSLVEVARERKISKKHRVFWSISDYSCLFIVVDWQNIVCFFCINQKCIECIWFIKCQNIITEAGAVSKTQKFRWEMWPRIFPIISVCICWKSQTFFPLPDKTHRETCRLYSLLCLPITSLLLRCGSG